MRDARFELAAEPSLILSGALPVPRAVQLIGARARTTAEIRAEAEGWSASIPLVASRWGGARLPLPMGEYTVEVDGGVAADSSVSIPLTQLGGLRAGFDGRTVRIGPPMDPAYDSGEGQAALERRYATSPTQQENAVFFESFYGQGAGCNPLAIDRELARRAPSVTRYWSVVDLSVAVPEGAIALVEGTPEWWRARAASRLLVVNDWLRRKFSRHRGQRVIQTWHGTPLKHLALHRSGWRPRRMLAIIRESRRWDVLLAQNPFAAAVLHKAYAFGSRPLWVEGYPRNDVLVAGDSAPVRAALGIAADEKVVMYAPTWRDDREVIVDHLDPAIVAAELDAVVLVRGHSRTLRCGTDAVGDRVIDVTGYPDTSGLLLATDILITDYSSVMFDFSITGKPMYFLTPDIEHYRESLREFYFDLVQRAPGPVVYNQDQLIQAIRDAEPEEYAAKYAAWRARFNERDDGHAAERVVTRILDQRFVDA